MVIRDWARYGLGILFRDGQGVTQDYGEAYFWFDLAAAGKLPAASVEDATRFRDQAASMLAPIDLLRVQERARKWFEDHPVNPQ